MKRFPDTLFNSIYFRLQLHGDWDTFVYSLLKLSSPSYEATLAKTRNCIIEINENKKMNPKPLEYLKIVYQKGK